MTARQGRVSGGFGAGVGAALVMIAVMVILRFATNTVTIPELVEKGLDELLNNRLVLFFTSRFGMGGQALLLVIIVEGTLLLRGLLGWLFTHLSPDVAQSPKRRWLSGLLYG